MFTNKSYLFTDLLTISLLTMATNEIDLQIYCRLCLKSSNEAMHHIFNEGLSNKIIIMSGLDVQNNDALPKQICRDCRYQLEKSYYFRSKAKQSDSRLRKHIRLINQKKPSNVLDNHYSDDESEDFEEIYMESYKYFEAAKNEIENLKLEFEKMKDSIIKEEIAKLNPPPTTLKSESKSPNKKIPDKPVLLNKCTRSLPKFISSPIVRRKKKIDSTGVEEVVVYNDYEIKEVFEIEAISENTPIDFIDGSEDIERKDQQESQTGYEIIEVENPIVEETPDKKKSLKNRQNVDKNNKQENNENIIEEIINSTGIDVTNEEQYFKPIKNVEDQDIDEKGEKKIFQCNFENCTEAFARRQACKAHFFNHMKSKSSSINLECQHCKKKFKVQSSLERHERIHTGEKPFKCDSCEKTFSQKELLKRHKITHLSIDEAPFACHLCDKRFRQKYPLRFHIEKTHSGMNSQLFTCNICNKSFAHSSGLSRHFLIHSGKNFTCECGKVFNDKSAFRRHKQHHCSLLTKANE
ncbi:CLUMA_CG018904, isoform A [Clunio marinus]|uniref:CLUMA_CG018904, isoform A n=1 Tax=Clunio marinus TaxID=568069 RepID=A0A1J1J567_9DIPT|nr:CLUMA_CG018904, isoform A [Clunio marinus]